MASKSGAFIPVYTRWNPETQLVDAAFAPDDYDAMRQGYGCTRCWADFRGVWLAECPTCKFKTAQPDVTGQWWLE